MMGWWGVVFLGHAYVLPIPARSFWGCSAASIPRKKAVILHRMFFYRKEASWCLLGPNQCCWPLHWPNWEPVLSFGGDAAMEVSCPGILLPFSG